MRRRRIGALGALAAVALLVIGAVLLLGSGDGEESASTPTAATAAAPPTLPNGARAILPTHRVVALYGAPQAPELGDLGIGTPAQAAGRLARQARPYAAVGRPILPAFQLLAAIAADSPGDDGLYRIRQDRPVIERYLAAARRAGAILILDIQPGRADFRDEVRALRPYLEQPDVSLALDPEWSMGPDEIPGQVIGSTDATVVNWTAAYLAQIVRERNLPQKLLIVHQFTEEMIRRKQLLRPRPGVALVLNVDGFGDRANKVSKYDLFTRGPSRWGHGFKLFYEEDVGLMTPRQVLALRPVPDVVVYE